MSTALATATLTLAAEAPDLDVISRIGGSAFGLNHHRGFTHSFLGIPLTAAAVVAGHAASGVSGEYLKMVDLRD